MTNTDVIQAATGQSNIEDALAWIAEGHSLKAEVSLQALLQAVVGIGGGGENHQAALRRIARAATESDLDTASAIYNPDLLGPLERLPSNPRSARPQESDTNTAGDDAGGTGSRPA